MNALDLETLTALHGRLGELADDDYPRMALLAERETFSPPRQDW